MKNKKFLFFLFFFLTLISLLYFFLKKNENKVDEKISFDYDNLEGNNFLSIWVTREVISLNTIYRI